MYPSLTELAADNARIPAVASYTSGALAEIAVRASANPSPGVVAAIVISPPPPEMATPAPAVRERNCRLPPAMPLNTPTPFPRLAPEVTVPPVALAGAVGSHWEPSQLSTWPVLGFRSAT